MLFLLIFIIISIFVAWFLAMIVVASEAMTRGSPALAALAFFLFVLGLSVFTWSGLKMDELKAFPQCEKQAIED